MYRLEAVLKTVMPLVVCIFWSGIAQNIFAADRELGNSTVREATINPRLTRLPIIDGYDVRFARFYNVQGPSISNVGPFAQDDQGFIWFGTPNGLDRFDGFTFKVFTYDRENPKSIGGSYVHALFKDRNGTLWAGSNQYLNRFDSKTETFSRFPVPSVYHISQDESGMLWLSTPTGLYALDPSTGHIRRFSHDPGYPASLESNDIKSTGLDKEGTFWVATSEGLDSFDRSTGKVRLHIPVHEPSFPFSFYEDRFGVFWIYHVSGNPLAVFDRRTNTLTEFSFRDENSTADALTGVAGILEDQNGILWLATNGAGLLKFDREHQRFVRYRNSLNDPESLAQNSVRSITMDREGIIWAGLASFGLTRFTPKPQPFKRYRHDFGNPADLDEPFVGAIYEDHQGVLWIGTHSALHRIDRSSQRYEDFYLAGRREGTDAITICEDRRGYLWVGTYGHGLFRFDPRTRSFIRFRHDSRDPHSLSNDIVPRLFVDHEGTLWAATHDGLDRFNATTNSFITYNVELGSIHPYYLAITEDRKGMLWLGTETSGLVRFEPATGEFTIYQHDENRAETLSDNRVNSILFDRSGTMWVGTQAGLDQFDEATGGFTTYSRREGLPGSVVGCVLQDERESLWMSTDNGVAKLDPKTKETKSYSTADGLPGPDLTGWGACFQSRTGEMFFGGFSGATSFFSKNVSDTAFVPPIVLTDFRLFGTEVLPGSDSPLSTTINYTNAITLSHKQNRFSIGFSALSYLNPTTNRYRYMLESLDRKWNEVGSDKRFASYTTLPAGTYVFRVQGATSRGSWDEPGARLRIEVLPAWWNSSWFRVTYIAALLLILMSIYIYHQQQKKREAEHTEKLRRTQTELAQINRVSTMDELTASLAHEIKQPIGAAVTNAEACIRLIDRSEPDLPEAREAALEMIKDARRAADIIEHVRSLYRKGSSPQEIVDINEVIREMAAMLQKDANRHSVTMHTDLIEGLPKVVADRVQLQQVLMNLMLNGIEAMGDTTGELSIKSRLGEGGQVLISVSDTGVGLPTGSVDEIFNAFFTTKSQGTGLGLAITRSIVESHGGRIWANGNSGPGATFQFTLPITGEAADDVR
jgi:signal transduction histidine kinase/ligand-binding sensor domain-containing protein